MSEAASAAPLLVSSAASAAFEAVSFAGRGYCVDLDKVFIVRIFSVLCMAAISVLRMAAVSASYGNKVRHIVSRFVLCTKLTACI
jgi:hypothetical protein